MTTTPTAHLKEAGERSIQRRHPWIFAGAIGRIEGSPQSGETLALKDRKGQIIGWGAYSPTSQIAIRLWSVDPKASIDRSFLRKRLERAIAMRAALLPDAFSQGCRLIHGESDGLPGLIIDRYGDFLVLQSLSAGIERWKPEIVSLLQEILPLRGIYERSDVEVRKKEGLPLQSGLLTGEEPPPYIEMQEGGLRYLIDIRQGHKTGYYLDQRANRIALQKLTQDAEVLNCFAYTGGFGMAALQGGAAHVTQIEASSEALDIAAQQIALNHLPTERSTLLQGDVFTLLRKMRDARRSFDVIILDPPKFAESKHQIDKAARGYKDINLLAFKLLRSGGKLLTFSCSGLMTTELFQKIVADAALDAHLDAQIIERFSQDRDHPTALPFPEGSYLKGLLCRISSL